MCFAAHVPRTVRIRLRAAVPQELGLARDPRPLDQAVPRADRPLARADRARMGKEDLGTGEIDAPAYGAVASASARAALNQEAPRRGGTVGR